MKNHRTQGPTRCRKMSELVTNPILLGIRRKRPRGRLASTPGPVHERRIMEARRARESSLRTSSLLNGRLAQINVESYRTLRSCRPSVATTLAALHGVPSKHIRRMGPSSGEDWPPAALTSRISHAATTPMSRPAPLGRVFQPSTSSGGAV